MSTVARSLVLALLFALPQSAGAAGSPALDSSTNLLNATANAAGFTQTPLRPEQIVANLIQLALGFVGVVLIILILYGGWLWGTAAGNEEKVTEARRLITESIIGLIIVLGAYFVVAFVVTSIGEAVLEPLFPF